MCPPCYTWCFTIGFLDIIRWILTFNLSATNIGYRSLSDFRFFWLQTSPRSNLLYGIKGDLINSRCIYGPCSTVGLKDMSAHSDLIPQITDMDLLSNFLSVDLDRPS